MLFFKFIAISVVFNSFVLPFPSIPQIPFDEVFEETNELVQEENKGKRFKEQKLFYITSLYTLTGRSDCSP